jgi:hypothetical protein
LRFRQGDCDQISLNQKGFYKFPLTKKLLFSLTASAPGIYNRFTCKQAIKITKDISEECMPKKPAKRFAASSKNRVTILQGEKPMTDKNRTNRRNFFQDASAGGAGMAFASILPTLDAAAMTSPQKADNVNKMDISKYGKYFLKNPGE